MRRFWIATLAVAVLFSSQATAISTRRAWDGSNSISSFGCPDTSTYGQVIKIPKFKSYLKDFAFLMAVESGTGTKTVRGEVYKWDSVNGRATGSAVYESPAVPLHFADANFHRVTFFPNMNVSPGTQYVIFATVDKDYAQCAGNNFGIAWGAVPDTAYANGTFVYLNDGGDSSQWTAQSWSTYGIDLVFTVSLPH